MTGRQYASRMDVEQLREIVARIWDWCYLDPDSDRPNPDQELDGFGAVQTLTENVPFKPPRRKPLRVRKWLQTGELSGQEKSAAQVIDACAGLMDGACACDILGCPAFIGDDGVIYVVSVEASIGKAARWYARELLDKAEED